MSHTISKDDKSFLYQVETFDFPVESFDHRAHVRLAYIYLAGGDVKTAVDKTKETLLGLLKHAEIDPNEKYHETLTNAWIIAVHHFMKQSSAFESANEFLDNNVKLLDLKIMMTHYSYEVLFSERARKNFVEPNISQIPRYS